MNSLLKIRIITHHAVHNHGAVLQLYALEKVLSKYDPNVCALDYQKNYDFLDENANTKYNISIKSIPYYLGFLRKNGFTKTFFNVKKRGVLESFKRGHAMVGEYYSRCKDLDAVFIGSDEVFSIEPGLNPFFWGMGVPTDNCFAYAGSFGPTTQDFIREKHAVEYIKGGISRFSKITVRDENSRRIIHELSGVLAEQVCDPVILYRFCDERNQFKRPMHEKYLFVYAYDNNMNDSEEVAEILQYAKENSIKVITAGFYHKWCDRSVNVNPLELLCWISFAECVITDTFHGTVMSMVMNTPFATKIRGNRNKLGFLLEEYNCQNREIKDFKELGSLLNTKMSFDEVNRIMSEKQVQGCAYIQACIDSIG